MFGNLPSLRPGGKQTFMSYDLPWANVSNAPFRLFKHWVHEGGISTPLIVSWPSRIRGPLVAHAAAHVIDIVPTLLEATRAAYPADIGGHELQPLDGESLLPLLDGADWQRQQPIFWEHEGNSAILTCPPKTGPFLRRVCSSNVQLSKENGQCADHGLAKNRL